MEERPENGLEKCIVKKGREEMRGGGWGKCCPKK